MKYTNTHRWNIPILIDGINAFEDDTGLRLVKYKDLKETGTQSNQA